MLPLLHTLQTRAALQKPGFSAQVVNIVSETSKWPDWYRWNDVIAHAATPLGSNHSPTDPAQATDRCVVLLRSYLERMKTADPSERLVWLGFSLHLVQDLAVHQGRTNAEHSFQALLILPNPDYRPSAIRRAWLYTHRLLDALPGRIGRERFDDLRTNTRVQLLSPAERHALLGSKDFSAAGLWTFIRDGWRYRRDRNPGKRVRWDTEKVLNEALRAFRTSP